MRALVRDAARPRLLYRRLCDINYTFLFFYFFFLCTRARDRSRLGSRFHSEQRARKHNARVVITATLRRRVNRGRIIFFIYLFFYDLSGKSRSFFRRTGRIT